VPIPNVAISTLQPEKESSFFQPVVRVPETRLTRNRSCRWRGLSPMSRFLIVIVLILMVATGTVVGVLVHKIKVYVILTPLN